jgi:hypothetical protein
LNEADPTCPRVHHPGWRADHLEHVAEHKRWARAARVNPAPLRSSRESYHETTKEDMMARWWRFFLALTRLSSEAVCEMSAGRGLNNDFHNYRDSVVGQPGNGYTHTCERCGKPFVV